MATARFKLKNGRDVEVQIGDTEFLYSVDIDGELFFGQLQRNSRFNIKQAKDWLNYNFGF